MPSPMFDPLPKGGASAFYERPRMLPKVSPALTHCSSFRGYTIRKPAGHIEAGGFGRVYTVCLGDFVKAARGLVPAMIIAVSAAAALCAAELLPFGKTILLVRLSTEGVGAALAAAANADSAFVGIPAPGYALVYGEASQVRGALGLAVSWKGPNLCSPPT